MNNIIYGRNAVREAIISKRQIESVLISETAKGISDILKLAKKFGIVIKFCNSKKIKIYGDKTQGVVAFCTKIHFVDLEEILNLTKNSKKNPLILICTDVKDPHNLGAMLRTAAAVCADGLIIPKRRIAPINGAVEKASAGAVNFIKIAKVSNIVYAIKILKKAGFFIYCPDLEGEDFTKINFKGPSVLVVGCEAKGVGVLIKKECDKLCKIPMQNKNVNSFNVSVASALIIYEIFRQNNLS